MCVCAYVSLCVHVCACVNECVCVCVNICPAVHFSRSLCICFNADSICEFVYVSLRLRMQNAASAQPCVGKLGISLVLLNFLDCNFRLWLETP